jgi:hypothetical protein
MKRALVSDRARFADGSTADNSRRFASVAEARAEYARILREVRATARTNLDLILTRDAPGAFFATNVGGAMRFERFITVPQKVTS